MNREEIVKKIKKEKIVAIVRTKERSEVSTLLKSIINGGLSLVEITANTPSFSQEITNARNLYSNADVLIGAGTVTTVKIAKEAIESGAQFLVTPNTNIAVIKIAHKHNIPVLMGAITPSEICSAVENGADIIKLFPAGNLGIDYFKAIRAPLDTVDFFVVGGINLLNLADWMAAGAAGVGLGSVLTTSKDVNGILVSTEDTANTFVQLIRNWNGSTQN